MLPDMRRTDYKRKLLKFTRSGNRLVNLQGKVR